MISESYNLKTKKFWIYTSKYLMTFKVLKNKSYLNFEFV